MTTPHRKQKLELTWIGKENRKGPVRQPPHLLLTLKQEFTGKIKCIYIVPPYNTGSAFEHYDDGIEHSLWLWLMRDRLELLKRLLREDGTLWVNLDDNEAHYCKVLMDELFGRDNFVASVI